jgi:hypothetical protein
MRAKTLAKREVSGPDGYKMWIHFMDDGAIRVRLQPGCAWSVAAHRSGETGTLIRLVPREISDGES